MYDLSINSCRLGLNRTEAIIENYIDDVMTGEVAAE